MVHLSFSRYHSFSVLSAIRNRIHWMRHLTSMQMAENISCEKELDPSQYTLVTEGKAKILFPKTKDVFYNPVQEFNRDLSIAAIKEFATSYLKFKEGKSDSNDEDEDEKREPGKVYENGITILEALAASGLRSIRYALEIPGLKAIVANDWSFKAAQSIERNAKYNNVEHLIRSSNDDAVMIMYKHRHQEKFHVVDLDPYGSSAPFLDAAVQCIVDGGLLLVTCTDVAILCGNASETCFAKYGSMSLKSSFCHEMALRILLYSIQSHATRYGRHIVPLISLSADFYVRIAVRLFTSAASAKHSASKCGLVYLCGGCDSFTLQPLGKVTPHENGRNFKFSPATGPTVGEVCTQCGSRQKVGGPIWIDAIHDRDFIQRILTRVEKNQTDFSTSKRIVGVLNVMLEELPMAPLFYTLPGLFSVVRTPNPKLLSIRSAILNAGYEVSSSHASPYSVKTNAPNNVIWDIIRAWAKISPPGKKALEENSPAQKILSAESSTKVSFETHPQANPESRMKKLVRFQQNPEPFWGPKCKSQTNFLSNSPNDKQKRNQGKRTQRDENDHSMKKYPCKRFKQGNCDLGDSCRYSHVKDEIN